MKYYPILLDLKGRKVVAIGGGIVAERKVRMLLRCKAEVTVVSPSLTAGLSSLVRRGVIMHRHRLYRAEDLRGAFLVLAATHERDVQEAVAQDAHRRRLLVNVADRTELCSFIAPSILTRGDLVIAISTGGASPALAQRLRRDLGKRIGRAYGDLLSLMSRLRGEILGRIPSQERRRRVFHRILDSGLLELLKQGKRIEAKRMLRALLSREGLQAGWQGLAPQPKIPNRHRKSVHRRQRSW